MAADIPTLEELQGMRRKEVAQVARQLGMTDEEFDAMSGKADYIAWVERHRPTIPPLPVLQEMRMKKLGALCVSLGMSEEEDNQVDEKHEYIKWLEAKRAPARGRSEGSAGVHEDPEEYIRDDSMGMMRFKEELTSMMMQLVKGEVSRLKQMVGDEVRAEMAELRREMAEMRCVQRKQTQELFARVEAEEENGDDLRAEVAQLRRELEEVGFRVREHSDQLIDVQLKRLGELIQAVLSEQDGQKLASVMPKVKEDLDYKALVHEGGFRNVLDMVRAVPPGYFDIRYEMSHPVLFRCQPAPACGGDHRKRPACPAGGAEANEDSAEVECSVLESRMRKLLQHTSLPWHGWSVAKFADLLRSTHHQDDNAWYRSYGCDSEREVVEQLCPRVLVRAPEGVHGLRFILASDSRPSPSLRIPSAEPVQREGDHGAEAVEREVDPEACETLKSRMLALLEGVTVPWHGWTVGGWAKRFKEVYHKDDDEWCRAYGFESEKDVITELCRSSVLERIDSEGKSALFRPVQERRE